MRGQNEDPEKVSEALTFSTNPDVIKMFRNEDFLTPKQILSFFQRHARTSDAT